MVKPKTAQGVTTQRPRRPLTQEELGYEPDVAPTAPANPYLTEVHTIPSGTVDEFARIRQALDKHDEEFRRQNAQPQERLRNDGDVPQGARDAPEAVVVPAPEYAINDMGAQGRPGFVIQDDEGWEYPR